VRLAPLLQAVLHRRNDSAHGLLDDIPRQMRHGMAKPNMLQQGFHRARCRLVISGLAERGHYGSHKAHPGDPA
jgi:hypothetical protein